MSDVIKEEIKEDNKIEVEKPKSVVTKKKKSVKKHKSPKSSMNLDVLLYGCVVVAGAGLLYSSMKQNKNTSTQPQKLPVSEIQLTTPSTKLEEPATKSEQKSSQYHFV